MQASMTLGPHFEMVDWRVARGRTLPYAGELNTSARTPKSDRRGGNDVDARPLRRVFEVRGSDMLDEGIRAGDRLLIESRAPIPDGVTALVDLDGRYMVKRFFREPDGNIRLEPANRALLPLVLRSDRVRVHGVVIGLVRRRGFRGAPRTVESRGGRGVSGRRRETADLTFRILEQNLGEWTRISETHAAPGARKTGSLRIRELGRSLRALIATYSTVSNPRLRRALLEEAAKISREMRYVAAACGWPSGRIRPLLNDEGDRARMARD